MKVLRLQGGIEKGFTLKEEARRRGGEEARRECIDAPVTQGMTPCRMHAQRRRPVCLSRPLAGAGAAGLMCVSHAKCIITTR